MDDVSTSSVVSKIIVAIFVVALFDLAFVNWWILNKSDTAQIYTPTEKIIEKIVPERSEESEIDKATAADSEDLPNKADLSSELSNTETTVETEPVVVQTPNKEIFVPLGSGQAKDDAFVDLYGAEVSIDTAKYTAIESARLEAAIWVEGSNGKAWAQLKNVTDNNPLIESQISNTTSTPTLKSSGNIPLASGAKTYRVQAKSELEEYFAYVENARLKITLK